jgi:hypothetical protein
MGTSDLRLVLLKSPQVRIWSTGIVVMVAMAMLCGIRIRYIRLLIGGVEEGGYSSGRCIYRVSVCYKFGVQNFGSIQGFKDDDFGSGGWSLRSRAS